MIDPILCCAIGVCCPPGSDQQREAYTTMLSKRFKGDEAKAKQVCDETWDEWLKMTTKLAAAMKNAEKK